MDSLVSAVIAHATKHYEDGDGWDFIVEAYSDEEIAELIGDAVTVEQAIANVTPTVNDLGEREADRLHEIKHNW